MREELKGIGIAVAIMAAVVAAGYGFTAAVGAGPTQGIQGGTR